MEEERAHLVVNGKVQGVFYRASAKEQADNLELNGWVRNLQGGSVEIIVEGRKENIKSFLDWCHKGPPNAFVSKIDTEYSKPTGEFSSFNIKY
ncbi:MAG: acylphosphatase [Thermodesulfobacteriota bacterium]